LPWRETSPMKERKRFVREHLRGEPASRRCADASGSSGRRATSGRGASAPRAVPIRRCSRTGPDVRMSPPRAVPGWLEAAIMQACRHRPPPPPSAPWPAPTTCSASTSRATSPRGEYDHERPHEALSQLPPVDFYEPSRRPLPVPVWGRDFAYPETFEGVRTNKDAKVRSGVAHPRKRCGTRREVAAPSSPCTARGYETASPVHDPPSRGSSTAARPLPPSCPLLLSPTRLVRRGVRGRIRWTARFERRIKPAPRGGRRGPGAGSAQPGHVIACSSP
jgi:hypothetical protein